MQSRSFKWPKFRDDFRRFRLASLDGAIGTEPRRRRWDVVMGNESNGTFGLIVGGVVVVVAAIFILSGGEFGGKKTVDGDQDLPPIATTDK